MVLKFEQCAVAFFGGLVVKVENCRAGMAGSNLPRHIASFFTRAFQRKRPS